MGFDSKCNFAPLPSFWSWNSSSLATSCEELTHWKRLCCWEGLGAGGEGDDRGWDSWMATLTQWTWVWVDSGSDDRWWTGRPGVLQFMELQRVGHNWVTKLNWTGIPSPPLGFFVVMPPKAHLTSHSRMSDSRSVITPSWSSGSWRCFLYSSSI